MINRLQRFLNRHLSSHREWLKRNHDLINEELDFMEETSNESSLSDLINFASSLEIMSTYYSKKGTVAVFDGDPDGWYHIHKAIAYLYLNLRIRIKAYTNTTFLGEFQSTPPLDRQLSPTACLVCYSTVFQLDQWNSFSLSSLLGLATWPDAIEPSFWHERIFEPFVLLLHNKHKRISLPPELSTRDLGVYNGIMQNWEHPHQLVEPLLDICDYHCQQIEDTGGDWIPEFKYSPFDLLPIEILTIYIIRERSGLETPQIDHPLLSLPLASVEQPGKGESDDVLRKVRTAYEDLLQEPWDS